MGAAKKKWLKVKCLYSNGVVAGGADFYGEIVVNIIWVTRLDMETSRTVAHLAACIFQVRGFSFGNKAS